ncbi:MAG: mycothiol system anti-sigma-R factor [Acidimicrobiales bacterium]
MGSGDADCDETIERLYTYLDGELTEERRAAIKVHLDECSPCLDAYDFEAELRVVIASRCKDHVPESLMERIRRVIADEERHGASG